MTLGWQFRVAFNDVVTSPWRDVPPEIGPRGDTLKDLATWLGEHVRELKRWKTFDPAVSCYRPAGFAHEWQYRLRSMT